MSHILSNKCKNAADCCINGSKLILCDGIMMFSWLKYWNKGNFRNNGMIDILLFLFTPEHRHLYYAVSFFLAKLVKVFFNHVQVDLFHSDCGRHIIVES